MSEVKRLEPPPSKYTEAGLEAMERLRFLASFPLPGTGKREGGEKKQPFNRFPAHLVRRAVSLRRFAFSNSILHDSIQFLK